MGTGCVCPHCLKEELEEMDDEGTARCNNCGVILYGG